MKDAVDEVDSGLVDEARHSSPKAKGVPTSIYLMYYTLESSLSQGIMTREASKKTKD